MKPSLICSNVSQNFPGASARKCLYGAHVRFVKRREHGHLLLGFNGETFRAAVFAQHGHRDNFLLAAVLRRMIWLPGRELMQARKLFPQASRLWLPPLGFFFGGFGRFFFFCGAGAGVLWLRLPLIFWEPASALASDLAGSPVRFNMANDVAHFDRETPTIMVQNFQPSVFGRRQFKRRLFQNQ